MGMRTIKFRLNGEAVGAEVATHETLVELLQGRFAIGSVRESCAQGLCGCCTVMVDGQPVSGCLYLAALVDGAEVSTVENSPAGQALDAVQEAFIETGAFQCGFCTPGMILMARELLKHNPEPSEEDARHYLSGNLCRCAAYPEILAAVMLAGKKIRAARP
jgi:carbon-monoxide dehydrogenase small subunit